MAAVFRVPRPLLTNPAFWFGLAVPTVMVVSAAHNFPRFSVVASWTAVLDGAGIGLTLAAPILAAGAAATVGSSERWRRRVGLASARSLLARVVGQVWPLLVTAGVGYVATALLLAAESEPVDAGPRPWLVVPAMLATALFSTLAGSILGLMLPAVVAVPVAGVGSYVAVVLPLVSGAPTWANLLGYAIPISSQSLSAQPAPTAVVPPVLLAATVVGVLLAADVRRRVVAVTATAGVLALGVSTSMIVASDIPFPLSVPRTTSELRCAGGDPELCLWPELEPERARLTVLAERLAGAVAGAGAEHPATVTTLVPPVDWPLVATAQLEWAIEPRMSDDLLVAMFARGLQRSVACTPGVVPTEDEYRAADRALLSLADGLGTPFVDIAWSVRSDVLDGIPPDDTAAVRRALGISSETEALAAYRDWTEEDHPCL